MRSLVKIYGPPVLKAIRALECISIGMKEVCIMDTVISREIPAGLARDLGGAPLRDPARGREGSVAEWVGSYFASSGVSIPVERCNKIISRSGESLGEYDFFFEWFQKPSPEKLNDLIQKVDEALAPLGCLYTMTTKE